MRAVAILNETQVRAVRAFREPGRNILPAVAPVSACVDVCVGSHVDDRVAVDGVDFHCVNELVREPAGHGFPHVAIPLQDCTV